MESEIITHNVGLEYDHEMAKRDDNLNDWTKFRDHTDDKKRYAKAAKREGFPSVASWCRKKLRDAADTTLRRVK